MPAGISKVEQNRFLKAAAAGAESVIDCMLARNCEITVEDEQGYTPLMLAAANGHTRIVRLLLPHCLKHPDASELIQGAFEAAVTSGHRDLAQLLIDIGVDPDTALDGMEAYWEPCPICAATCCPAAGRVCPHWVCASSSLGFGWFGRQEEDFDEEVEELFGLVEDLFLSRHEDAVIKASPPELQELIRSIEAHGRYYWASGTNVQLVRWEKDGELADAGYHFYHRDPNFCARVKEQAQRALGWFRDPQVQEL